VDRYTPINIPKKEINVKINKKAQLISKALRSPVNPIKDFSEIINKDVATAFLMGSLPTKTSAGIIKNPPPIPAIPESKPIITPILIKIK